MVALNRDQSGFGDGGGEGYGCINLSVVGGGHSASYGVSENYCWGAGSGDGNGYYKINDERELTLA